jgi:hypothetical protein
MRCCSPLVEEKGSQIIVVVVNLLVHPCPMLLIACQTCYYAPPLPLGGITMNFSFKSSKVVNYFNNSRRLSEFLLVQPNVVVVAKAST